MILEKETTKRANSIRTTYSADKRTTVGSRIRLYMKQHGLKQVDLLNKLKPFFTDNLKISKTDLSQYVNDKTEPRSDKLHILAKGLDVDEAWLLGFDDKQHQPALPPNMEHHYRSNTTIVSIPLLGEIACGEPITAEENVEDHITHIYPAGQVPEGNLFDLRAKGDSMDPTIPNGAIVTVREQPEVEDGQIAAVLVNGDTEATLKRVKHINGMVVLQPDNDTFDPIILTKDHPGRIIGRAIEVKSKL